MVKLEVFCDYCGHVWSAERRGDGALNKFYVPTLDSRTCCEKCMQRASNFLIQTTDGPSEK